MECFSYKGGDIDVCIEPIKRRADLGCKLMALGYWCYNVIKNSKTTKDLKELAILTSK